MSKKGIEAIASRSDTNANDKAHREAFEAVEKATAEIMGRKPPPATSGVFASSYSIDQKPPTSLSASMGMSQHWTGPNAASPVPQTVTRVTRLTRAESGHEPVSDFESLCASPNLTARGKAARLRHTIKEESNTDSPAKRKTSALLQELGQMKIALGSSVRERNALVKETEAIVQDYEKQLRESDQHVLKAMSDKWDAEMDRNTLAVEDTAMTNRMRQLEQQVFALTAKLEVEAKAREDLQQRLHAV